MSINFYSADDILNNIEKARIYRGYSTPEDLCAAVDISIEDWRQLNKTDFIPESELLVKFANTLDLGISYYFIKDADPKNFDLRIIQDVDAGIKELNHFLMPFVETAISENIFNILNEWMSQKGIYTLVNEEPCGLTRSIDEFRKQSQHVIFYINCLDIDFDFTDSLEKISMIIFDNASCLKEIDFKQIFDYRKIFKGAIVLAGRALDKQLKDIDLYYNLTSFFPIDILSISDLHKIVKAALPQITEEVYNVLLLYSDYDLNLMYMFIQEVHVLTQKKHRYKLNRMKTIQLFKKIHNKIIANFKHDLRREISIIGL